MNGQYRHMAVGSWHRELGGTGSEAGIRLFALPEDAPPTPRGHLVGEAAVGSMTWQNGHILALDERKGTPDGAIGGRLLAVDPWAADPESQIIGQVPTLGPFPCSLARDPQGAFVAVVNYGSEDFVTRVDRAADGEVVVRRAYDHGSVALFGLDERGTPGLISDLVVHGTAVGVDRVWQLAGHPHSVAWSPDGRYVAVADRGGDAVTIYAVHRAEGRLTVAAVVGFPQGEGPRTVVFDGRGSRLFVANELRATVAAFAFDPEHGTVNWQGLASTDKPGFEPDDPDDFFSLTHPSVLVLDGAGKNLYVLNRGPNTIAWFDVHDGRLEQRAVVPSGGSGPWGAGRCGERLWIAHRIGGEVVEFDIADGRPVPTGRALHVPGAVSVAFEPR